MSVGKLQFFRESEQNPNFFKKKKSYFEALVEKLPPYISDLVRPLSKLRLGQGKGES